MSNPNPSVIGPRKRLLPAGDLRELQSAYRVSKYHRGYALGERNPKTLPGVYSAPNRSETVEENREASARWARLGKLVKGNRRITHRDA